MRWSWVAGMRRRMSSEGGGAVGELAVPREEGISTGARSAMASVG
jgi:hypothetical protein